MRLYTKQHKHYCGIDLHTNKMYLCILSQEGEILLHRNIKTEPETFLKTIAPYRDDLVVCAECMFSWYWLADLCAEENIPFILGHALYMRAIHGGKSKNDKIDSQKIAALLEGRPDPHGLRLPAADAGHAGPDAPAQPSDAQAGRALCPHPEHRQSVQSPGSSGADRQAGEPGGAAGAVRRALR